MKEYLLKKNRIRVHCCYSMYHTRIVSQSQTFKQVNSEFITRTDMSSCPNRVTNGAQIVCNAEVKYW